MGGEGSVARSEQDAHCSWVSLVRSRHVRDPVIIEIGQ